MYTAALFFHTDEFEQYEIQCTQDFGVVFGNPDRCACECLVSARSPAEALFCLHTALVHGLLRGLEKHKQSAAISDPGCNEGA